MNFKLFCIKKVYSHSLQDLFLFDYHIDDLVLALLLLKLLQYFEEFFLKMEKDRLLVLDFRNYSIFR